MNHYYNHQLEMIKLVLNRMEIKFHLKANIYPI